MTCANSEILPSPPSGKGPSQQGADPSFFNKVRFTFARRTLLQVCQRNLNEPESKPRVAGSGGNDLNMTSFPEAKPAHYAWGGAEGPQLRGSAEQGADGRVPALDLRARASLASGPGGRT